MARAATFGGGTLSPFGGAATDFGAFNIGAAEDSKTVSAQEQAALAFALISAQHNNGLITDAAYAQAQEDYLYSLAPDTQAYQTAKYTVAMTRYTNAYNDMAQKVQTGVATPQAFVDFNRGALSETTPGSTEYTQRQDRLFSSQNLVFSEAENEVMRQYNAGSLTDEQVASWYDSQWGFYSDNYAIQKAIKGRTLPSSSSSAKTVSTSESAAMEFAVARAQHEGGQMSDAAFESIQSRYLMSLSPDSQAYRTAAYTIAAEKYTNDYNRIAQGVQTGEVSKQTLVDFNRKSLEQVVAGSNEYYQRQDRLASSEGAVFQEDEEAIITKLNKGKLNNTQVQEWYLSQAQRYAGNNAVAEDIQGKIIAFADRIVNDADQLVANRWNDPVKFGAISLTEVISYAAKAALEDPGGARAKGLAEFADAARVQSVEGSLKYRYDLTREAKMLQQVIASVQPLKGGYSTSTKTRTYWDGTKVVTASVVNGKVTGPSASQIKAHEKQVEDARLAKIRLTQIEKMMETIPGGWATDQDYIRNLTDQQSKMVKNSPQWLAIQAQIDGHTQRIQADELIAKAGIKIALPGLKSEMQTDLTVGSFEQPAGFSAVQISKLTGYQSRIDSAQALLDSGTLTPEQEVAYQAQVTRNQQYIVDLVGEASKPATRAAAKTAAAQPGGTSVGTTVATGSGNFVSRAATSTASGPFLTLRTVDEGGKKKSAPAGAHVHLQGEDDLGQAVTAIRLVKPTGISSAWQSSSPAQFDDFHNAFVAAVKDGKTQFVDSLTGMTYIIPTDPQARLDMIVYADQRDIEYKTVALQQAYAKNPASVTTAAKRVARDKAVGNAMSNLIWIMDTESPGVIKTTQDGTDAAGRAIPKGTVVKKPPISQKELAAAIRRAPEDTEGLVNPIGYGIQLLDLTIANATAEYELAEACKKNGDWSGAVYHLNRAKVTIQSVSIGPDGTANTSYLAKITNTVNRQVEALVAEGGEVPEKAAKDIARLNAFSSESELGGVASTPKYVATGKLLFGEPETLMVGGTPITRPNGKGLLKLDARSDPVLAPDKTGKLNQVVMNEGWTNVVALDGTITADRRPSNGRNANGPIYADVGEVNIQFMAGGLLQPGVTKAKVVNIGQMTVQGFSMKVWGKQITVNGEIWTEDPFHPGTWIPDIPAMDFAVPAGAEFANDTTGPGNVPDVPAGTPIVKFIGKDGKPMFLIADVAEGGYRLYQQNPQGAMLPFSNGYTSNGEADKTWNEALAGFGFERSKLNTEQKGFVDMVSNGTTRGGAFLGLSAQEAYVRFTPAITFTQALAMANKVGVGHGVAGSWSPTGAGVNAGRPAALYDPVYLSTEDMNRSLFGLGGLPPPTQYTPQQRAEDAAAARLYGQAAAYQAKTVSPIYKPLVARQYTPPPSPPSVISALAAANTAAANRAAAERAASARLAGQAAAYQAKPITPPPKPPAPRPTLKPTATRPVAS